MHRIAECMTADFDCWFTPYYSTGIEEILRRLYLTEMSIMGHRMVNQCLAYLKKNNLPVDYRGAKHNYDLVVTCADIVVQNNIKESKVVLVQEGMTDPENFGFRLVKMFPFLPRWIASTSTFGLSNAYDLFCVASEGYKRHFTAKGIPSEKIVVTGIPNFDNCARYRTNNFPYSKFVLVCTSDARETFKFENRKKVILDAVALAGGRQLIFKLHPNENIERAEKEINTWAPGALVFSTGSAEEMIANCDVLITQWSSTVYVGLALGKEVYSNFDLTELRQMIPEQNSSAAQKIAGLCRTVLEQEEPEPLPAHAGEKFYFKTVLISYTQKFMQFFAKAS